MKVEVQYTTILIWTVLKVVRSGQTIDCLISEEKGWFDMDNVYQCDTSMKCCKEYGKPSCCGQKDPNKIARDQAMLWGGLIGFLIVIGLVMYCRKSDFYCMEGQPLCQRCCPCCKRKVGVDNSVTTFETEI